MSIPNKQAPQPRYARELAEYTDDELGQYLDSNGRYIHIQDPENLPDKFLEILQRARKPGNLINWRKFDANTPLHALWTGAVSNDNATPPYKTVRPVDEQYRDETREETNCYNTLIDLGGRPSHPLHLFENAPSKPEYRDIVSFWQRDLEYFGKKSHWVVFDRQLERWQTFQSIQWLARGRRGLELERSIYDNHRLRWKCCPKSSLDSMFMGQEYRPESGLPPPTYRFLSIGSEEIDFEDFLEHGGHSGVRTTRSGVFPAYTAALKERLEKHGFTQPFQLEIDLSKQDRMATWIEYLGFEYWWYDRYISGIHSKYFKLAWKNLLNEDVFRPTEAEDDVYDALLKTQAFVSNETQVAKEAKAEADRAVLSLERTPLMQSPLLYLDLRERRYRMMDIYSKADVARRAFEAQKKRDDRLRKFRRMAGKSWKAIRNAKQHRLLLAWILQQIPIIESELNPVSQEESDEGDAATGVKRKRSEEKDEDQASAAEKGDTDENLKENSRKPCFGLDQTTSSKRTSLDLSPTTLEILSESEQRIKRRFENRQHRSSSDSLAGKIRQSNSSPLLLKLFQKRIVLTALRV